MLNSCVISRDRKTATEGAEVTRSGRLFQTHAAATGKARTPTIRSWVRLTISDEDELERSRWWALSARRSALNSRWPYLLCAYMCLWHSILLCFHVTFWFVSPVVMGGSSDSTNWGHNVPTPHTLPSTSFSSLPFSFITTKWLLSTWVVWGVS